MKIFIIGVNGTSGKKVVERLIPENEVIIAGPNSGDVNVDISDRQFGQLNKYGRSVFHLY